METEETWIFNSDDLTDEYKEIAEGIEARKIKTGSIEMKIKGVNKKWKSVRDVENHWRLSASAVFVKTRIALFTM